jgi:pimeloyl-ACP methyl ester carboxylesterase
VSLVGKLGRRARIVLLLASMGLPVSLERLLGGERLALLREVSLMPRDLTELVPDARAGDDVVVLVHGFLASAGVFRPLSARLQRETGARVASFTHAPGVRIGYIARRLGALVERLPRKARITVVGHSIGGLAARWYVQELGGHARVARTISLASPFGGIDVPQLLIGADLHTQSAVLERLRSRAHVHGVPHTSIVGAEDTLVEGVGTACLGFGDVVVLPERGHNGLLFCERAAAVVIDRVKTRAPAPTQASSSAVAV